MYNAAWASHRHSKLSRVMTLEGIGHAMFYTAMDSHYTTALLPGFCISTAVQSLAQTEQCSGAKSTADKPLCGMLQPLLVACR
jgi:hypothetical protein